MRNRSIPYDAGCDTSAEGVDARRESIALVSIKARQAEHESLKRQQTALLGQLRDIDCVIARQPCLTYEVQPFRAHDAHVELHGSAVLVRAGGEGNEVRHVDSEVTAHTRAEPLCNLDQVVLVGYAGKAQDDVLEWRVRHKVGMRMCARCRRHARLSEMRVVLGVWIVRALRWRCRS